MIYIALLRGINVGGHTVKMDRLRELFSELGFANVRTFIQSGNVFFESDQKDRVVLAAKIEKHLLEALGYEVPVFLRTTEEIEKLIELNPFKNIELTAERRFSVTFTAEPTPKDLKLPLVSSKNDLEVIAVTPYEAFAVWHINGGRPPTFNLIDKTFSKRTTTRFFPTLIKLLAAAKAN